MSNHLLLHVSVLSLFFVSGIGNNCLDQFTVGYICHLIVFLPIQFLTVFFVFVFCFCLLLILYLELKHSCILDLFKLIIV